LCLYLEETLKGSKDFFQIFIDKGGVEIQRRQKQLSRFIDRMGKTILITDNFALERDKILELYRRRNYVESLFDTLKNEIKDKRLRVHSSEVMEGRLFVSFLSPIIHSALTNIMREKEFFKKYTIPQLLLELKKIKIVEMENKKIYSTEITKKQRDIFHKFDLKIPSII